MDTVENDLKRTRNFDWSDLTTRTPCCTHPKTIFQITVAVFGTKTPVVSETVKFLTLTFRVRQVWCGMFNISLIFNQSKRDEQYLWMCLVCGQVLLFLHDISGWAQAPTLARFRPGLSSHHEPTVEINFSDGFSNLLCCVVLSNLDWHFFFCATNYGFSRDQRGLVEHERSKPFQERKGFCSPLVVVKRNNVCNFSWLRN